jgi:hypothetical protein
MPEQQSKTPNTPEQSSKTQKDIVATAGKLTGKAAKGFVEGVSEGLKTLEQIGKYGIKFTGFPAEGLLNLSMFIGGYLPNVGITAMRNFLSGFYGAYKGFDTYPTEEYPQWKYTTWSDIGKVLSMPVSTFFSGTAVSQPSTATSFEETEQLPIKQQKDFITISSPMDFDLRWKTALLAVKNKFPDLYEKVTNDPEILKRVKAMLFRNLLTSQLITIDYKKWNEDFRKNQGLLLEWSEFLPFTSESEDWKTIYRQILGLKTGTLSEGATDGYEQILNKYGAGSEQTPQQSQKKSKEQ